VTDGNLTIQFIRQVENAKISGIEILPVATDTTPPLAPTDLAATGSPTGIALDWANNTESDLAGYNVYRSTSATGTFNKVNNSGLVIGSAYTDVDAPAGAPSFYRVTAVDNATNESQVSNTASATRTAGGIRINTGGPAQSVGGVAWSACTSLTACNGYVTGGFAFAQSPVPTITGMVAPANQAVYQTEWTGGLTNGVPVGGVAFTFGVPVTNGTYLVRLHFAELNKNGAGLRVFDVNIEGGPNELTGFDIWQQAAGINNAIAREFTTTVTDGNLTIQFIRQVENAKISGIEILPVATDTTPPAAPVISAPPNNSFDTDGVFTVSGTAEAASTVNLFEGTTNRGTATASAGGSWSIPLSGVADGVHTYTATATDAATNTSPVSVGRTITVDSVRPLVSTTVPIAGASGIAVGANVTATFSEPMTAASLTTTSFSLAPTSGGPAVAAAVTYDPTSRVATLDPSAALAAGVSYTATITTGAADLAGNSLATARTWSFSTATATGPASLTFVSAADTYARSLNPTSNYGLETTFRTRLETSASNPRYTAYLRFQVTGLGGRTVTGATLRLYSTDGGPNGGSLYRTATTWTETGLTASNAPASTGSALASVGVVATNAWHELSLPAGLVTGDGPLDLVIVPLNSNSVLYSSRQGSQPPELVLQLSDGGPTALGTRLVSASTSTPSATAAVPTTPSPGAMAAPARTRSSRRTLTRSGAPQRRRSRGAPPEHGRPERTGAGSGARTRRPSTSPSTTFASPRVGCPRA
jgi:fibronectin type 3 domain-containing protein